VDNLSPFFLALQRKAHLKFAENAKVGLVPRFSLENAKWGQVKLPPKAAATSKANRFQPALLKARPAANALGG
jgi:hypothetical protein